MLRTAGDSDGRGHINDLSDAVGVQLDGLVLNGLSILNVTSEVANDAGAHLQALDESCVSFLVRQAHLQHLVDHVSLQGS